MIVDSVIVFGYSIKIYPDLSSLSSFAIDNPGIFISLNAESLYRDDSRFLNVVNENYGFADGIGAVAAVKILCKKRIKKTPGCEVWLEVLKLANYSNKRVAFIGGTPHVITALSEKIKIEYSDINVVFLSDGYYNNEDVLISQVVAARPDIVFVALGQPKQEFLCESLYLQLKSATFFPVGGSFDIYTEVTKRAPSWVVNLGLEWMYRLVKQPSRWRRQLVLPKFIYKVLKEKWISKSK